MTIAVDAVDVVQGGGDKPRFDDLMLAMDAVDTLRHEASVLESELASGDRREALKARLREYYAGQGISVSDEILETAVSDMDKNRFVHEPLKPGLARLLATVYVRRVSYGLRAGVAAAVVAAAVGTYPMARYHFVELPRERAAAARELLFSATLPSALEEAYLKAHASAEKIDDKDAGEAADVARASGDKAVAARDEAGANKAIATLDGITKDALKRLAAVQLLERLPSDMQEAKAHPMDAQAAAALVPFSERMEAAAKAGNETAYLRAKAGLDDLVKRIMTPLELRIVDRPGSRSGVWRTNDGGRTKIYYLVVEAVDPAGRTVPMDIKSVENGRTATVKSFAIHVPQSEYDRVARDKQSDGLVDDREAGEKPAGSLGFKWSIPAMDGQMITDW